MDKLIFERCNAINSSTVREPARIEFEVQPNITVSEFKICCKRLAHALGYSVKSIVREFGEDEEVGNPSQIKMLFD